MFKVIDKTTGEIFTVYGTNGTHFIVYDAEHDFLQATSNMNFENILS